MAATYTTDGIGTRWWFELLDREIFPQHLAREIDNMIEKFDMAYSRFKANSYIGRLNTDKYLDNPPEELIRMLEFAREMFVVSHGAFNVSVGGALHAQGYGSRSLAAAIDPYFWDTSEINKDYIKIPPSAVIDNGGFGKGWLIDSLAELFRREGYNHWIINGGGDMLVSSATPVTIGLEHPDGESLIGRTQITRGALAASSNQKRTWVSDGKLYHHIISPGNDRLVVEGTYVKAPSALIADSLATIVFLRPDLSSTLEQEFDAKILIYPESLKGE